MRNSKRQEVFLNGTMKKILECEKTHVFNQKNAEQYRLATSKA
jgi:hypothetical protein